MKPIRIHEVISTSKINDWEYCNERKRLDHKSILTLHIKNSEKLDSSSEDFFWNHDYYDNHTHNIEVLVEYAGECAIRYPFSVIGSHGLMLPLPKHGTNKISYKQLNLAKIINKKVDVIDYIDAAGLILCD